MCIFACFEGLWNGGKGGKQGDKVGKRYKCAMICALDFKNFGGRVEHGRRVLKGCMGLIIGK